MKSLRTSPALIVTTLMLAVMASTTANAQTYTDLYNLDDTHGSCPAGAYGMCGVLAQGRDGNLYGATTSGGTARLGVVFRITPGGTLRVLHDFAGVDGSIPAGGLTLGTDGDFYGTTALGGANGYGTIFKITKSGILTTLYSFTNGTDGSGPYAPPVEGTDGDFYGTTGPQNAPTAYKVSPSGKFNHLAALPGADTSTATGPAQLIQGTDGNFYGTTQWGKVYGTVFKMTPQGSVTIIHRFNWAHGIDPFSPVVEGSDGNFYGTTFEGGKYTWGVVYKLTPQGTYTVLHNFPDPAYPNDGQLPYAGLLQATDGAFYGVTPGGGTCAGCGVIFQIAPDDTYKILYDFGGGNGHHPQSALMQHTNGQFYGLADSVVYSFDMGFGPFVSLVRTAGKVGQIGGILGQGFTGTTNVSLSGVPANFTVRSDTFLTATVPAGATTGYVTVATPSGTLTSNVPFHVIR